MTLQEFLTFENGIFCDYDGAFGDQCFDLANAYSRWIGGPRFTGGTADLIFNQPGDFYEQIHNTPDGIPQAGDIVIWSWPHVGIATGNNSSTSQFEVLEQNDPTESNCHRKVYLNYNGVIGWLRPKKLPVDLSDELRKQRDDNWNLYQGMIVKLADLQNEFDAFKTSHPDVPAFIPTVTSGETSNTDSPVVIVSTPTNTVPTPITPPVSPVNSVQTDKKDSPLRAFIRWLFGI